MISNDSPAPDSSLAPAPRTTSLRATWPSWAVLNLAVIGMSAAFAFHTLGQYEQKRDDLGANLAYNIEKALLNKIDLTVVAQKFIAHQLTDQSKNSDSVDLVSIERIISEFESGSVETRALRVTDAKGILIAGDGARDAKPVDYSGRSYFKQLAKDPSVGMIYSEKLTGLATKRSIIAIAVPWFDREGRFAGVVTSTIALKGLEVLLKTAASNPDDSILIRDSRNKEILVSPALPLLPPAPRPKLAADASMPASISKLPVLPPALPPKVAVQAIDSGLDFGRFVVQRADSPDHERHFSTFKRVPETPLFLIVSLGETHLAPWRHLVFLLCAFAAGFALVSALAAIWLGRHERRLLGAETSRETLRTSLQGQVNARTSDLQEALERLTRGQQELAVSEKLASLGKMVAGVSHELSTPLGNALLTASAMSGAAQALELALSAPPSATPLKRSVLAQAVSKLRTQAEVQKLSIEHATHLVRAFKQVAVDQTSERKREFDLGEALETVVASFMPTIARASAKIDVHLDAPRGVHCDTFPGALVQIASNMMQNSLRHAFNGRTHGTITIRARAEQLNEGSDAGTWAVVEFEDDGGGLPEGFETKIFEPYFTTQAHSGGSGLGLSLSQQLARTALGGELSASNAPKGGATFTLRFPAKKS